VVDTNVRKPVEKCVEQSCNWWCVCCNKWFCFIVWVVLTVAKWVIETICEIVADVVDVVVAVVVGIVNIVIGIFTWNWGRVWDALVASLRAS
jgi:phage-related protein